MSWLAVKRAFSETLASYCALVGLPVIDAVDNATVIELQAWSVHTFRRGEVGRGLSFGFFFPTCPNATPCVAICWRLLATKFTPW